MTKKDYIKAAEIARIQYQSAPVVVKAFVEFFQGDNPNFDCERFVNACKPKVKGK